MLITENLNEKQRAVIAQLAALSPKPQSVPASGDAWRTERTEWELRQEKILAAAE